MSRPVLASSDKTTGFKKRQQVARANKNIFVWVAVASLVVAICLVFAQFLVQRLFFNQKIINEKSNTNTILVKNIKNAEELKKNINNLIADTNLAKVKVQSNSPNTNNLQVVLDALPTANDGTTFANSLANVVLVPSGVKLVSLTSGENAEVTATQTGVAPVAETPKQPQTTPFSFTVSGDYNRIKTVLADIDRVIRPIKITTLSMKTSETELTVSVGGVTYYMPASSVELQRKSIKP